MAANLRVVSLLSIVMVLAVVPLCLAGTIEGDIQFNGLRSPGPPVVYILDIEEPAVHAKAVLDQKNLQFVPHVLVIQRGTTVEVPNSDPLKHNVFSISEAKRFNLGMYSQGESRSLTFQKPGIVQLSCAVHLQMSAYIVVVPNRYFAIAGPDGHFRIADVPAGHHRLRYWQESSPTQELEAQVPDKGSIVLRVNAKAERQQDGNDE
jgi:plastocyanin